MTLLILSGLVVCLLSLYLAEILRAACTVLRLPRLEDTLPDLPSWPRVTVVVAACDEEKTIESALKSLLKTDYPDLELVVVDDRSKDGTGGIVDRLSEKEERVRVRHIKDLPEGWLGKVNALEQGTRLATGKYIIYTDADVHYMPDAIRRAVALCERENLGHLALLPRIFGESAGMMTAIPVFLTGYLNQLRVHAVGRPGSDAFAGAGAFNMVRREDLERTEGFSWLRMEVADDVALGMMMVRQAGVRSMLATAVESLSVLWYSDVPGLIRGLEKSGYTAIAGFRMERAIGMILVMIATPLSLAGAFFLPFFWTRLAGTLVLLSLVILAWSALKRARHPPWATLLSPITLPLFSWIVLRSTWKTLRSGGITWRGTFYPLDKLKAGHRVKL